MPESMQIIISIIIVLLVYILTMIATGWWTRRIALRIIKELDDKGAINATTAINLPYAKTSFFRFGYRDYRPKALESLVMSEVVIKTLNGQYYLNKEKLVDNRNLVSK